MKVEIDFPSEFGSDKPGYIHLGRLVLSGYICRLVLSPTGGLQLACPEKAVGKGIILLKGYEEGLSPPVDG